ncbi:hypothetical protein OH77DRAFT_147773 [Trametes cingulata]|nr:hypothetical protein OH77DRAFT_147773 [Trametes cingulata]
MVLTDHTVSSIFHVCGIFRMSFPSQQRVDAALHTRHAGTWTSRELLSHNLSVIPEVVHRSDPRVRKWLLNVGRPSSCTAVGLHLPDLRLCLVFVKFVRPSSLLRKPRPESRARNCYDHHDSFITSCESFHSISLIIKPRSFLNLDWQCVHRCGVAERFRFSRQGNAWLLAMIQQYPVWTRYGSCFSTSISVELTSELYKRRPCFTNRR